MTDAPTKETPAPSTPLAAVSEGLPQVDISKLYECDIRVGTVVAADKVPNADKLIRLEIDFGPIGKKQILTAMAEFFAPEHFLGKQIPAILNLKPRMIRGLQSQGMILASDVDGKPYLLVTDAPTPNGAKLK